MNYYEILEITQAATDREVKIAYRRMAKLHHPDVNPRGEAKFKQIQEAYDTLSDRGKRSMYDLNLVFDRLTGPRNPSGSRRFGDYGRQQSKYQPPKTMTFRASGLTSRGRYYVDRKDIVRNLREAAIFFKDDARTTQEIITMLADVFENLR